MDIRGHSRIEIRCAEEDASRESRQSFEAHRRCYAAKGFQSRSLARLKSLSCKQPQRESPARVGGAFDLKGETARQLSDARQA
jgi:hypothetical protein